MFKCCRSLFWKVAGKVLQFQAEIAVVNDCRIDVGQFDDHSAESVNIPFDDPGDQINELIGGFSVQLPGHAAIDKTDFTAGQDKDIAWMRICMEKAKAQALFEYRIGAVGNYGPSLTFAQFFRADC